MKSNVTICTVDSLVSSIATVHACSVNVVTLFQVKAMSTRFGAVLSKHLVFTY